MQKKFHPLLIFAVANLPVLVPILSNTQVPAIELKKFLRKKKSSSRIRTADSTVHTATTLPFHHTRCADDEHYLISNTGDFNCNCFEACIIDYQSACDDHYLVSRRGAWFIRDLCSCAGGSTLYPKVGSD